MKPGNLQEERSSLSERTIVDFDLLDSRAEACSAEYQAGKPYPHILFDDFIDHKWLNYIHDVFPTPEEKLNWRKITAEMEGEKVQYNKLGMPHEMQVHPVIRELLWEFNSGRFIRFLERLTGIKGLIPDPLLQGGGLHQTLPGGVLAVHADFTRHRVYNLDRRLNVLLYLNKDWLPEYGGHIELWSQDMSQCMRRIIPHIGRCLIFNTDSDSFHGHPEKVACPDGMTRKSVALYYYTNGRDDRDIKPTNATDWQKLPAVERPPLE